MTFAGQVMPLRMTVARLSNGSLWLHSPLAWNAALGREIDSLGPVQHLVAPSKYHHLWVGDWAQRYPKAQVHGAPGLAQKRTDLRFEELGKVAPPTWSTELEQCVFRGLPIFNEVVFFHRASRTLIVSDLVFHIHEARGLAPLLMRLNGMWKRFGPSRLLGWMMRRNREVSRADLERILAWDFERVVMAHGTVLEQGGRTAFERAFAFLLEKPPRGSR